MFGLKKAMRIPDFDLKAKFITSDKILIRRLWGIFVYNVVKSKIEIFVVFFSTFAC